MTARERQDERHAQDLREEAALPLRREYAAPDPVVERAAGRRVFVFALALTLLTSLALEYGGWQILRDADPEGFTGIAGASFLRGTLDTMLGAVGVGTAAALATLLVPSTWKRPWRRLAVGFLGGAAGFLGFLSALTLPYFL